MKHKSVLQNHVRLVLPALQSRSLRFLPLVFSNLWVKTVLQLQFPALDQRLPSLWSLQVLCQVDCCLDVLVERRAGCFKRLNAELSDYEV